MFSIIDSEKEALQQLGKRLRTSRKKRGDRQEDAAARCGVSTLTYQKMENGNPGTSVGVWVRAIRLYGAFELLPELFPLSLFGNRPVIPS